MSFVAVPSAGAPTLARLLGLSPAMLEACHKRAAWATLFWGGLHAFGELIYLASQGKLDRFSIHPSSDSDNLTFVFGLISLLLLGVLAAHALSRHRVAKLFSNTFRGVHRVLVALVLLMASAHWWPFALFLAPAISWAATGRALGSSSQADTDGRNYALALAAAIVATFLGIILVWASRQSWMLTHPHDYYTLNVYMFPPAAVGVAFTFSRIAAAAVLKATKAATIALPTASLLGDNSTGAA